MSSSTAELKPICTTDFEVQIPPFGAREFPVARGGSSHFSLKTQGAAIVLGMPRPVDLCVKMYKMDSTIHFGSEAPGKRKGREPGTPTCWNRNRGDNRPQLPWHCLYFLPLPQ